jgi:hypothetical protein
MSAAARLKGGRGGGAVAGMCLVNPKSGVRSHQGRNSHPTSRGCCLRIIRVTWGGKRENERYPERIASDGAEFVPTTDVKISSP